MKSSRRDVAVQAVFSSLGTLGSRVLGLARESLLAAFFDRTVTDAWFVAFRLPNLFRRMLGEGALAVNFIPVFVDLISPKSASSSEKHDLTEAHRLVNGMFTVLLGVLVCLTAAGILFAPALVELLAGGKGVLEVPGKLELTIHLSRIMFAYVLLVSLYAYFMAILNTLGKFGLPAFAPALFNVVLIGGTMIPHSWGGSDGTYMSWAVIIGGVVQMGVLLPALAREGFLPKITWPALNEHVRKVFGTIVASWLGIGILQMTVLVNTRFASELEEGTQSWINWADRVLELPLSLFAVALGSALLPTLARHWSKGEREEMFETSAHYLRLTFFIALPAALGCYALADSIVILLFNGGKFGAHDVEMTSAILRVYSLAIFTYGGIRILVVPFYAVKNTKLPALVSGVALIAHVILAFVLVKQMGAIGLATATVFSSLVNLGLLFACHYWLIGPLKLRKMAVSLAKFSVAGLAMLALISQHSKVLAMTGEGRFGHGAALVISGLGGLSLYLLVSALLKTEEFTETWHTFSSKLNRRLKA